MPSHSISVALCTYNGERYLEDQLCSFLSQSRRPDELVVCDDCSQDKTVDIIHSFTSITTFPVRLSINSENLGTTKNFEKAVRLCAGEIIALADQDDVWHPKKLAQIEAAFSATPSIGLVFSDAEMVDEHLQPLGYRLWQSLKFGRLQQRRVATGRLVDVLLKHNVVAGATMAIRAGFTDQAFPIPRFWMHDGWIALLIAAMADVSIIKSPLLKYRQHPTNQIGAVKKAFGEQLLNAKDKDIEVYAGYIEQLLALRERLTKFGNFGVRGLLQKVDSKISHLQVRRNMPERRLNRLLPILKELMTLRYFRYSNGSHSLAKDLFLD